MQTQGICSLWLVGAKKRDVQQVGECCGAGCHRRQGPNSDRRKKRVLQKNYAQKEFACDGQKCSIPGVCSVTDVMCTYQVRIILQPCKETKETTRNGQNKLNFDGKLGARAPLSELSCATCPAHSDKIAHPQCLRRYDWLSSSCAYLLDFIQIIKDQSVLIFSPFFSSLL